VTYTKRRLAAVLRGRMPGLQRMMTTWPSAPQTCLSAAISSLVCRGTMPHGSLGSRSLITAARPS
jgi:hypothetical protein